MRNIRKALTCTLLGSLVALASLSPAMAQSVSDKPIRWLVGFPAGGATDTYARTLAQEVEKKLNRKIVIENKPGAGTFIAVQALKAAPADGSTMMVVANDTMAIMPHLFKAPYDVAKDFDYVASFGETPPSLLIARNDFPANNLREAVAYIKANEAKLNYANAGVGTIGHIRMELFLSGINAKVGAIPYKGGSNAIVGIASGEVDMMVDGQTTSLPMIKAGRYKALAVMSKTRIPELPDTMSVAEVGATGGDFPAYLGIIALKGTPPSVLRDTAEAVKSSLALPALKERFVASGLNPKFRDGTEFRSLVETSSGDMAKVIAERGIKAE